MSPIRLLTLFWLLAISPILLAETAFLRQAGDLLQLGTIAKQKRIPILLMVSQEHCEFCELMKQEVLNPMLLSGEYSDKVLMRELLIDPGEQVTNFAGQQQSAQAFSSGYKVWVTPTLLFLDPQGEETAERILGINTVDYLLFYVEDAIDTATPMIKP
jgi:thioredoxin-related protein